MRWSIVLLVAVGIVAALSAALLVGALRADAWRSNTARLGLNPDVTVVVASRAVPPNTILDASSLTTRTLKKDQLPENALTDPLQAVGKLITTPLVEGQAVTTEAIAPEGTGLQLAAHLPPGKRAVGIAVTDHAGLYGILYPGCMVDVIVSVRASRNEETDESISATLLENVQVLAVERHTVVSPQDEDAADKLEADMGPSRSRKVTLMVTPRQAKELQLAGDIGTLSLALRNPNDTENDDRELVSLKAIAGARAAMDARWDAFGKALTTAMQNRNVRVTPAVARGSAPQDRRPAATAEAAEGWSLMVIRGGEVSNEIFPMPEDLSQAADQ